MINEELFSQPGFLSWSISLISFCTFFNPFRVSFVKSMSKKIYCFSFLLKNWTTELRKHRLYRPRNLHSMKCYITKRKGGWSLRKVLVWILLLFTYCKLKLEWQNWAQKLSNATLNQELFLYKPIGNTK